MWHSWERSVQQWYSTGVREDILCLMYNLHYIPTILGVQRKEKLYLGIREQIRLNTTGVQGFDGKARRKETTWKKKA
jgi:hypothetical protein